MKIVVTLLLFFWSSLFFSQLIVAQDVFQVLRDNDVGYAEVKRGVPLIFPQDHFPHPDYRIEWWYMTANLKDQQGQDWGLQWTLFRQSLSPDGNLEGWDSDQIWMAHAAVTTPDKHFFAQRFSRGGIDQAGVNQLAGSKGFDAWIDDWRWQSASDRLFPSTLEFNVGEHKVSVELNSKDDWVLNGDAGFSQKSAQGQASYYYSQPNITVKGAVKTKGKTIPLSGNAWLDREWSSQALAQNQKGWDWFSLHLDDGNKLMVYQLRHDTGNDWISGSWTSTDGEVIALGKNDIELNSSSERQITTKDSTSITLPLDWTISVSSSKLSALNRSLTIKPLYDEQWLSTSFPYWEGVVLVSDDKGQNIGKGYMELTGYQTKQ
ncbi:MAG: putative secreted hydrolase [Arenicella sp.]